MNTIETIASRVKSGKSTAVAEVRAALERAKKHEGHHAFISMLEKSALKKAAEIDKKIAAGQAVGRLAGVPYALKDNFLSTDGHATAAAKMLENFKSPLTATCVRKIEAEDAICIGRTNLDAYAHGSSTENSYFGPTKNAFDKTRVAGGSSGGSAAVVGLGIVPFALGSDTGGSIRQPASFNNVVGVKPTYGMVSRFGVVAMASSTDSMGVMAGNVTDAEMVMDIMAGQDERDGTTWPDYFEPSEKLTKPLKIGVISECVNDKVDPKVTKQVDQVIKDLKSKGHKIETVSLPMYKYALAIYYVVSPAEVCSNLGRFDGIRYGYFDKNAKTLDQVYGINRNEGFMPENKRRIMIGNYVLSSGFFDAYYLKAQRARTLLIQDFDKAFAEFDALISPVSPNPAFKLGSKTNDPIQMYLEDIMSVPASLAGLPAYSIPAGKTDEGLPVGVQIIGQKKADSLLFALAKEIEQGVKNER